MTTRAHNRIIIDVTHLIDWYIFRQHPSGIQRYTISICDWLHKKSDALYCTWNPAEEAFTVVDFEKLSQWIIDPTRTRAPLTQQCETVYRHGRSVKGAIRDFYGAANHLIYSIITLGNRKDYYLNSLKDIESKEVMKWQNGDILLILSNRDYNRKHTEKIHKIKIEKKIKIIGMIYDVIPLDYPEFFTNQLIDQFQDWYSESITRSDGILTISHYSKERISKIQQGTNGKIVNPIIVPVGSNLREGKSNRTPPSENKYILCVGSIEPRKNQDFLANIWSELVRTRGITNTPTLYIIGNAGPDADPLLNRIKDKNSKGCLIRIETGASEEVLENAYEHALFTVFPSIAEGWGLPVTESLSHGRFCIASSATAIPEAAEGFAELVDPRDGLGWIAAINKAIDNPKTLESHEKNILSNYQPKSWETVAKSLLDSLNAIN